MIGKDLAASVEAIQSRHDFVAFVQALREDLQEHPENWENQDLVSFFDALARWVSEMDGYYKNHGLAVPKEPSWKILGDMLIAASAYE